MNLEEMKKALESDATKEAKRLRRTVRNLRRELDAKNAEIEKKNDTLRVMYNRCYVTMATLCFYCPYQQECKKLRSVGIRDEMEKENKIGKEES